MSSDFAFSETTPLRQSDCSNGLSVTTTEIATAINSKNFNGNSNKNISNKNFDINLHSVNSNKIQNNDINRKKSEQTNLNSPNSIIQLESIVNPNNNGITNRVLHHSIDRKSLKKNNNNNNNNKSIIKKMDTDRKVIKKIAFDFVIILCVGVPILCFFLFVEPYKRGFFCDDESLKHPFHDSTVKNYMLYLIGLVLPVCIILPMEFYHGRYISMPTHRFMDFDIPAWIIESYKQVGVFAFGAGSQQLVVDIAKYSVGRLRPHFFDVCQPIMPDGTRCDNAANIGRYIEEFTCEANNSTPRMLKDMRLSFPSGHASFSAFTMIYCMIYLQAKMNWRGSKLLKHFLQLLLFSITWFTALSRISDYKHHWSDVLAGGLIGVIFAFLVAECVADFRGSISLSLPTTKKDIVVTTNLNNSAQIHHQQFSSSNRHQSQQQNPNSSNGRNHSES